MAGVVAGGEESGVGVDADGKPIPGIVLDAGFTPNKKGQVPIHAEVPSSNKNGHQVTAEEDENNVNISRLRIIIENTFARIKQWRCLAGMVKTQCLLLTNHAAILRQVQWYEST